MPALPSRLSRLFAASAVAGWLFLIAGSVSPQSGQGAGTDLTALRMRVEAGQYLEAERELERYLGEHPGDAEAWELLGICLKGRWNFEAAGSAFRRAIDLGRESAPLLRNYVECEGRSSGALALLIRSKQLKDLTLRALELEPQDVTTRAALATYYYYLPGARNREKSERIVQELVELSPADGYYLMGIRAREESKPDSVMLDCFERSLRQDPTHPLSLLELGKFWISHEEWETGMELYRRALAAWPGIPEIRLAYARGYRSARMYEEAGEQFTRTLEVDPYYAPARLNLAENYEKRDMLREAYMEYQRLARYNPTYQAREIRKRLRRLRDYAG